MTLCRTPELSRKSQKKEVHGYLRKPFRGLGLGLRGLRGLRVSGFKGLGFREYTQACWTRTPKLQSRKL